MARRRTEIRAFVLDLADRRRGEAVGAIPVLRDRLREKEPVQANFILVRGNMIEERWASEWWDGLGKMERGEFGRTARHLVGRLAIFRTLVPEASAS